MADDLPPIKARIVLDDAQVSEAFDKIGKQGQAMGSTMAKSAETGRLGIWALGESAENLAQSFGVPNKMSRQLGNSVERLTASMGSAAVALGVVGLAAMAAYAIWSHFAEAQKKAREDLEKSVESLLKEETALYGSREETAELSAANENLRKVKKQILDQDFVKYVQQEREALKELREELEAGGSAWLKTKAFSEAAALALHGNVGAAIKLYNARIREGREETNRALLQSDADLRVKIAQRNANELSEQDGHLNQMIALEERRAAKYEEIRNKQRAADYKASLERVRLAEQETERRIALMTMTAGNFAQTGQLMASLGGSNARKWFSLQKTASIAEAIINTSVGATKALAQGGYMGILLAASVIANGMAQVQKIRSQTFEGGGGGAVGTFSANPVTGLPAAGGAPTNVVININGQQAGMYELAGGVLRELSRNNGSIDGFSVLVEGAA